MACRNNVGLAMTARLDIAIFLIFVNIVHSENLMASEQSAIFSAQISGHIAI